MTKPTEHEPDRSTPESAASGPAPVWDGALPGRDAGSRADGPGAGGSGVDGSADGGADGGADTGADGGAGRPGAGGPGAGGPGNAGPNGRADDAPPRLPPPWERAAAVGAETATMARVGGDGPSGDRYGSTQRSGAQRATATEDPADRDQRARESDAREEGARRPVSPELGDARTTEVDSRSIWTGQPNPPPGGFPAGWPRNRRPRQANLQLKRLDPWSVLKIALVLAVVLYLVWMVAVGVLYGALDGIGVWDRLNGQYADLVSEGAGDKLISAIRVFGVAAVVGAVNSLLVAVAFSVSAFIYNVSADLVGGIEVTLSERD